MFLSKLILNHRSRAVRRDLADCQELHRTLMAAFPHTKAQSARDEFGLLFRLETSVRSGQVTAIVQSALEPSWGQLPSGYLLEAENNPACKPVNGSYSSLMIGQRLAFRLRANPTKKIGTRRKDAEGGKSNGQRIEIRGEENQIAWLHRKADQHGFRLVGVRIKPEIADVRARPENKVIGWREVNDAVAPKRRMTFAAVAFEGVLEITDADKFKQALADGIGSGKAYGFGLLSIAPAGARTSPSAG